MAALPARASLLGQDALARFIADGHLATHLRRTRLLYARRQEVLLAVSSAISHAGWKARVMQAPHTWSHVRSPQSRQRSTTARAAAAAQAGIAVSPLSACYVGPRRQWACS